MKDVVNRMHVAIPQPRDHMARPAVIPAGVAQARAARDGGFKSSTEKDLQVCNRHKLPSCAAGLHGLHHANHDVDGLLGQRGSHKCVLLCSCLYMSVWPATLKMSCHHDNVNWDTYITLFSTPCSAMQCLSH